LLNHKVVILVFDGHLVVTVVVVVKDGQGLRGEGEARYDAVYFRL
jgi:hypothetical protein